jgi:hypothetical protein
MNLHLRMVDHGHGIVYVAEMNMQWAFVVIAVVKKSLVTER